jgi:hypothetical protein
MTYQEAKDRISELVNRFSFHLTEYKKGHYNETQTRNDFINPFPIPQLPEPDTQLTALVETMLQLHKDLQAATLPEQIEQIKARITYTDKKIDHLVYELYELTDEEIRIVEGEE